MKGQFELLKWIAQRQRSFGMACILPAFTGHVPQAISRLTNNTVPAPAWVGFTAPPLLHYTDPLFREIGRRFISFITEVL
jgi:alpha-N-acetylglucosaminidase